MIKLKKVLVLALSTIMISAVFAGCGNSGNSSSNKNSKSSNTLESVKKSGVLKIGLEDSFPPMEFRDKQNQLKGFDVDLGTEIGKKLGVKTQFVSTDFNGIILALKSGKFDAIMSGMSITDERKKQIDFSEPYVMSGQIIVIKNGNAAINKSADLKGKTVGVELGTTGEKSAEKLSGIKEIKKYDKATEALQDLFTGRIDAVIIDEPVGRYYISSQNEKGKYKVLNEKLTSEPMGIGFKKGDKELETSFQKAINDLKKDGTLSKLSIKWFGSDIYKK
ncbi:polar amino acid transport system substrate-binding protein [Clostridium algifaecis]|uniref:Polar amino acid transport system substrate-binding protein n=1 Tax=Clostridium algifaecis TaxID=1472040 RepID=A0ABS4KQG2_9CLOT|nr:ABC transporter substrate-binding protein [Clostridium algifaecis]MBP2032278.1 polar amino acid transport system substrate-binding protein [Clostridium algifaecis]